MVFVEEQEQDAFVAKLPLQKSLSTETKSWYCETVLKLYLGT